MGLAADLRDECIAEARRVMELSARHGIAFEYTADGWRMVETLPLLPPMAEGLPHNVHPIRGESMPAPPSSEVRTWAVANGVTVGARGRISADVVAAYQAAQQTTVARAS